MFKILESIDNGLYRCLEIYNKKYDENNNLTGLEIVIELNISKKGDENFISLSYKDQIINLSELNNFIDFVLEKHKLTKIYRNNKIYFVDCNREKPERDKLYKFLNDFSFRKYKDLIKKIEFKPSEFDRIFLTCKIIWLVFNII